MTPRKRYSFWIDDEQVAGLKRVKDRDGVLESEQIRRAINDWLAKMSRLDSVEEDLEKIIALGPPADPQGLSMWNSLVRSRRQLGRVRAQKTELDAIERGERSDAQAAQSLRKFQRKPLPTGRKKS
jgi:hypothetical protein